MRRKCRKPYNMLARPMLLRYARLQMRSILGLAALLAAAVLLIGCGNDSGVSPSGEVVTQSYDFTDFVRVKFGRDFEGTISYAETFSISVEVDEALVDILNVRQSEGGVVIELNNRDDFPEDAALHATVTMPELVEVRLTGGAHATIDGFPPTEDFTAVLDGGSALEGQIDVTHLNARVTGGSSVGLTGGATEADLDASGASTFSLRDLVLEIAHVDISGSSYAELNVLDELGPVDASGDSHVRYHGTPNVTGVDTSGESTVEPAG